MSKAPKLSIRLANNFGNIEIQATIDDLRGWGICFGDSVTVTFNNGYAYQDIPYYNSFLGPGNQPCLYGFADAYHYVGIGYPVTGNPWKESGVTEDGYAIISLCEKEKYLDEQKIYGIAVQTVPLAGMTGAEFANFRPLPLGDAQSASFFRCANPLYPDTFRAREARACVENLKPNLIINLSDPERRIDAFCRENPHSPYARLRESNAVISPCLEVDFRSASFAQKTAQALTEVLSHPAPYLIHCRYGVDRTGFLCILLEALAGTPSGIIARDYMLSYGNVYGVPFDSRKYHAIQDRRFGEIATFLSGLGITPSLSTGARQYLLDGGMSTQDIERLSRLLA